MSVELALLYVVVLCVFARSPEAEAGVGEVRWAVELSQVQAASHVTHGWESHIRALCESPA